MPYTLFAAGNRAIEVQHGRNTNFSSDVAVDVESQST
jgi:hypothetical protein